MHAFAVVSWNWQIDSLYFCLDNIWFLSTLTFLKYNANVQRHYHSHSKVHSNQIVLSIIAIFRTNSWCVLGRKYDSRYQLRWWIDELGTKFGWGGLGMTVAICGKAFKGSPTTECHKSHNPSPPVPRNLIFIYVGKYLQFMTHWSACIPGYSNKVSSLNLCCNIKSWEDHFPLGLSSPLQRLSYACSIGPDTISGTQNIPDTKYYLGRFSDAILHESYCTCTSHW